VAHEYVIYCDESEEKGKHFSNFYGGVLVRSGDIDEVRRILAQKKHELNLHGEVKWNKITGNYQDKYIALMDTFLDLVAFDNVKVRIMFTQNTVIPKNLNKRHIDEKYFMLYYQLLKLAFGLQHSPLIPGGVRLRIYPDKLPDTEEQIAKFRGFLVALERTPEFRRLGLTVRPEDVADVASHDHDLLQCLDIVLGAMHFRLNDKHLEKPPGKYRRGKRTVAKENVYNHINRRIRAIYPHFNIGISTGHKGDEANRWKHPYRHWLFVPTERIIVPGSKRKK
jgi:hypothetical protein